MPERLAGVAGQGGMMTIKLPVRADSAFVYDADGRPVLGVISHRNDDTSVVDRMLTEDEATQVAAALNATATPAPDLAALREAVEEYRDTPDWARSYYRTAEAAFDLFPDLFPPKDGTP